MGMFVYVFTTDCISSSACAGTANTTTSIVVKSLEIDGVGQEAK